MTRYREIVMFLVLLATGSMATTPYYQRKLGPSVDLPKSKTCSDPQFPNFCTQAGAQLCCAQGYTCTKDGTCALESQVAWAVCDDPEYPNICNGSCCRAGFYCNNSGHCIKRTDNIPAKAGVCSSSNYPYICPAGGGSSMCCAQGTICNPDLGLFCVQAAANLCPSTSPTPCNGKCCKAGSYCDNKGSCKVKVCGDLGQAPCAGSKPCRTPLAKVRSGKCKDPCGGRNMRCCQGFDGDLDYSGSSGSRACNPGQSLGCSPSLNKCRKQICPPSHGCFVP